jgi:hypothetical protein
MYGIDTTRLKGKKEKRNTDTLGRGGRVLVVWIQGCINQVNLSVH